MRQVARRLRDGRLELVDVADPAPGPGSVSVRVEASLLSAGTERATLEVARAGLIAKARARPDQARQVMERMRREGVRSTLSLVRDKLAELGPLGYSAAGVITQAGAEARGLSPGDRVAIAGGGFASHSEIDVVPSLLCAKVPAGLPAEEAAFATVGSVALNGWRRANVQVGSTVAVIGLGLIGQLSVQIGRAAGCRIVGVDREAGPVAMARAAGADALTRAEVERRPDLDDSADAVLVCAAAGSNDPVLLAASLARPGGTVVVVGDVRMELPRGPFYEKELDLRLSRSYGPGRYDPNYELHGLDYPAAHVRWTEQRNMGAFLALAAEGRVRPADLITHRIPFAEAHRAFELLASDAPSVGIVLRYGQGNGGVTPGNGMGRTALGGAKPRNERRREGAPGLGLIGAGSFATGTLIPGMLRAGFRPVAVASAAGLSAESARRRFGFGSAHSDPSEVIGRDDVDVIAIATRHDSHAELAALALESGRPVYVEKPLALDWDELSLVRATQLRSGAALLVGFNRRFAPLAAALRELPGRRLMRFRVNAGRLPAGHWLNDPARGGGRLKGEGCHFIDFLCDQAGGDPISVSTHGFRSDDGLPLVAADNFSVAVNFEDGSVGTLHYASDAPTAPGKEHFELSVPGVYAEIDDFRRGRIWRERGGERLGRGRRDKGFDGQFRYLSRLARGAAPPPATDSYWITTLATLAAARSLETGAPEAICEPGSAPLRSSVKEGGPRDVDLAGPLPGAGSRR